MYKNDSSEIAQYLAISEIGFEEMLMNQTARSQQLSKAKGE